jgi:hypothetical protein
MNKPLYDRIAHTPLDTYVNTAREHGRQAFLEAHRGALLLVSRGPVEKDDPLQTQRFAFGTTSGSLGDLEEEIQQASRAVYVLQWHNIDWSSPLFYNRRVWIGRAPNVAMRIQMPSVSKSHGYIRLDEGILQFYYADVGSRNGSRVNGKLLRKPGHCTEELPIGPGSELNIAGVELDIREPDDFFDMLCR